MEVRLSTKIQDRSGTKIVPRNFFRLAILLLLVSLVSVATLAKHSFGLPHSSPSHWVSQTCKMREAPRATSLAAPIFQAAIVVRRCHLIPVRVMVRRSREE